MSDIYHDPEVFDLELIGTLEEESNYSFDILGVWRRKEDGAIGWAHDSGCSCPSPFETFTEGFVDLNKLPETMDEFEVAISNQTYGVSATDRVEFLAKIKEELKK